MRLATGLFVGICALTALAATADQASAQSRGHGNSRQVTHARPARPMTRPMRVYGARRFDLHAGWGSTFGRPSRYGAFGYDRFGYGYNDGFGYPGGGYADPYGSVRITGAPRDAAVYVDGAYAGVVNEFDGVFQRLRLEPGNHRLEVRGSAGGSTALDLNVQPGRTMKFKANLQP